MELSLKYKSVGTGVTITAVSDRTKVSRGLYVTVVNGEFTIPAEINGKSVTCIGAFAFSTSVGLTSLTIPDSVTVIGTNAFYGCSELKSVTIGNSVRSIGDEAFSFCSGLTSITFPASVTYIGNYVFYQCTGLTKVILPYSLRSIGSNIFYGCTGLKSVTMSKAVVRLLIKNTFPPDIEVIYDIDGWWKGSE